MSSKRNIRYIENILNKKIENENVFLSGAAKGADLAWGTYAEAFGHEVIHFIFDGFPHRDVKNDFLYKVNDTFLYGFDDFIHEANSVLKRKFPTKDEITSNFIRRDFFQVFSADKVYAISEIDPITGLVGGGTGWGVQLYKNRFTKFGEDFSDAELYVFCQDSKKWYEWVEQENYGGYQTIKLPPLPTKIWAGIGSRNLQASGKKAIDQVFSQ